MGLPANCWPADTRLGGVTDELDCKLFITASATDAVVKNISLIGFFNTKSKTIVMPIFYKLDDFDPVSKLAYAEDIMGRGRIGTLIL